RKAVFILVDGIPADVVEQVSTPYLDKIAQEGGYTRAYVGGEEGGYSESPTISAVGYNSMLTGTWANKHNVWGNSIKNPNYHYWTIFRFFEEQYPEKKTAIFSTWLDNRTKLVGEGLSTTGNIQLDYHFDGFELDTVQFPHDEDRDFIRQIDEHVVQEAARYLEEKAPDLSWVYLEYTDDMGHRYGDGERMNEAVKLVDEQVGKIWKAIQQREQQTNEAWLIIITTDHGRDAETGKNHGGQSERERTTWIATNAKNLNDYFHQHQPAIVDIMPTLADFLNVEISPEHEREVDGVSLTNPVSLIQPHVQRGKDQLVVSWKAIEKEGKVKIWLSSTNQFKDHGKSDAYKLIGETSLSDEQFTIDLTEPQSAFHKVVIEGSHNAVNQWVVNEEE
ncbi:MAG: alkaline phosphatase family protein, partial [Bacteroidota bacterium]